MGFQEAVVGVDIEVNRYLLLEGSFKLLLEVVDKLCYPAIIFVVFLSVGDKNIILVSGNEAGHSRKYGSVG